MKRFLGVLTVAACLAFAAPALAAVIYGDGGNNTLNGTPQIDEIHGRAGDDALFGFAERDRLFGDDGTDRLHGGPGNDDLFGGVGPDTLFGGTENDTLIGEDGMDTIYGEGGDDGVQAQSDGKHDYVDGGGGFDTCLVGVQDTWVNCESVQVWPF